jgi:hypothetical protein
LQFHPEEEKQLIEHKFPSSEDAYYSNHFTHILSDRKKIKVEIYLK